jgi:orotidine-5'-phosphate decarboxylase
MIIDKLLERIMDMNNPSCIGLDTTVDMIPEEILSAELSLRWSTPKAISVAITTFNKVVIDSIYDIVPAIKIQIAMYEKYGVAGIQAYIDTVRYAKSKGLIVIGDAKRADVLLTSTNYSEAHLGAVDISGIKHPIYNTEFLTVNPYLGHDSLEPFIEDCKTYEKGIFVLAKTSNKGSEDIQNLVIENSSLSKTNLPKNSIPLYIYICHLVNEWGKDLIGDRGFSSVGAVVGATHPSQLQELRNLFPNLFFLVPGYGAQGGTASDIMLAFRKKDHLGALINNSRGIINSYKEDTYIGLEWPKAIRQATLDMRNAIDRVLN